MKRSGSQDAGFYLSPFSLLLIFFHLSPSLCHRQTRKRAIKAIGITGQYTSVMVHRASVRKGNTLRPTNAAASGIGVFPSQVRKMRAQGKRSNARSWVFRWGVNNTKATTVALQRQVEL